MTEAAREPLGAILELRYPDGSRRWVRAAHLAQSPHALAAVWPLVVKVLDPEAMSEKLIGGMEPPLTRGDNNLVETDVIDFEADGAAVLENPVALTSIEIGAEAKAREIRRGCLFGVELSSSDLSPEEQAALRQGQRDKQRFQDRAWRIFNSPARLAKARAALEARKPLDNELASLLYAREEAARAAALVAMERTRDEFRERERRMIASFEKGDPNWKAAGWPELKGA